MAAGWLMAMAVGGGLLLGLLLFLALRQRARRRGTGHGRPERFEGVISHRQVRMAIYLVLLAAGGHALLLAWQAESSLERYGAEAEAANLAGRQRMHSQRIGRIVSLLAPPEQDGAPDPAPARAVDPAALAEVLAQAKRDTASLKTLLHAAAMREPAEQALDATVLARWDQARTRLLREAEALLAALRAGTPAARQRIEGLQQAVEPALAAAEQLVTMIDATIQARRRSEVIRSRLWAGATAVLLLAMALLVAEPTARAVKAQYLQIAAQTRELERLALVAELTQNAVMITDGRFRMVWVNEAFCQITGYAQGEALGRSLSGLLHCGAEQQPGLVRIQQAIASGSGARSQVLNRRKDGSALWLDIDVQPLREDTDGRSGFVAVAADITERRRAQADLRIAAIAFDSLEAIAITNAEQVILRVNAAFTRITGYSAAEAHGQVVGRLLRSGRHGNDFYEAMWRQLKARRHWQGEVWNRRKDGQVYPEWLSITAVTDDDGAVVNYVAVFTDITQKKLADETIHNLAFYDALTELPNRRLMRDRLDQLQAAGPRQQAAAVLFIDLDNFKELNDSRGHDVGDALLIEVARRLRACVRVHDTVSRQGGDEFVVILCNLHPAPSQAGADAQAVAEKIRAALSLPYQVGSIEWHCTASIGICMLEGGAQPVDEILKRADIAMYEAKRAGRNVTRFYDPATHAAIQERIALEADLRQALAGGQLLLHFQPQVDAQGRPTGAEALLRWRHPARGLVPPGQFIALAEETDLILPIGQWVLEEACSQLRRWSEAPATRELQLAVNVSARQFRQADFVEQVRQTLRESGASPQRLKLELTESLVLVNLEDTLAKMQAIRALGVRFAIDDFGTGQSSLAYLTRLTLDQLKIDQAFVASMLTSHTDAVIVQTVIGMAHSLGLDVIAEGVETAAQVDFLQSSGCHAYQGYLFGKPMPIGQFERHLGCTV